MFRRKAQLIQRASFIVKHMYMYNNNIMLHRYRSQLFLNLSFFRSHSYKYVVGRGPFGFFFLDASLILPPLPPNTHTSTISFITITKRSLLKLIYSLKLTTKDHKKDDVLRLIK